MSTPVVVLAKQRSGTNLLRKSLASSSDKFKDLNEVFHSNGPGYFWKLYINLISEAPHLSYPSKQNRLNIFDAFLNKIREFPEKFTLVDIKYNSTHHFNLFWYSPLEIPFLFRMLAQRDIPVIHLVRNNVLETYLSEILSVKSKVYVIKSTEQLKRQDVKVKIEINDMLNNINFRVNEINLYRNWLKNLTSLNSVELAYDSLLDAQGHFSETTIATISDLLGIDKKLKLEVATQKVTKPLTEIIENYDEVAEALQEEGFSYLMPSEDFIV